MATSIRLDPLQAVVGELEAAEQELKAHLETHADVFALAKELRASIKERKELVCDQMIDHQLDEYVAGDRVFTRTAAPKILVNQKRVETHLGAAAFQDYAAANQEITDRVSVKKRKLSPALK